MKKQSLIVFGIVLLSGCNSPESNLNNKIACSEYVEARYENELTDDYVKRFEYFYSTALDTCIVDSYESLYLPGQEGYFTRMILIDALHSTNLISYYHTNEESNDFDVSLEEYVAYRDLLKDGTPKEFKDFKESLTRDYLEELGVDE